MDNAHRPSPAELEAWGRQLADGALPAGAAARLLAEVECLRREIDLAQQDAYTLAAVHIGRRLSSLAASGEDCPTCHHAEARAAAAWLRRAAGFRSR